MNSQTKISVSEGGVEETLLLPLWGRAYEARREQPRLLDRKAVEIIDQLDYDFSTIEQTQSLSQHSWVARSLHTDRVVRAFIGKHPNATVVNLGCGLDTTFSRVDNGKILFYELDLPDVIALRRTFYGDDTDRHRSIASSLHDTAWFEELGEPEGLLLLAGGVFMYSADAEMRSFFIALADHFRACELCFDSLSPLGLKIGKKMVLKKGGMDSFRDSEGWALPSPKALEAWDDRFRVVEAVPMHRGIKSGLPLKTQFVLSMPDWLGIAKMIHLRIGPH